MRRCLTVIIILYLMSVSMAFAEDAVTEKHNRSRGYIGFGIGGGIDAKYKVDSQTITFDDWLKGADDKSPKYAFNFKVGATLSPKILLGFDLTGVHQIGSVLRDFIFEKKKVDASIEILNYFLTITHFPMEEGFFIRTGAGYSSITASVEGIDEYTVDGILGRSSQTARGYGFLGGVGYAFWLGQQFNLTVNIDHSRQFYSTDAGKPNNSHFTIAYMGFDWY